MKFYDLHIYHIDPYHIDTHQIKCAYQKLYSDQIRVYLGDAQLSSSRL